MSGYYQNLYLEIDTCLEFGKYKGETVEEILTNDPSYLRWLAEEGVEMDEEILEEL